MLDPSDTARKLLALRLSAMDLALVEAGTLEDAELALAGGGIGLVITEWKVRDLEGRELLKRLAKPGAAVLVFTDKLPMGGDGAADVPENTPVFHKSQRSELLNRVEEYFGSGKGGESPQKADGRHVLLIEDSPTIRGLLKRIIQKNFPGWVIREAQDGREAFSEMTNQKVDFIVTDLQMPGMDGESFLKNLRRNPLLKNKPVLVLSGAITSKLREEFKACETVRLLAKPSSENEIAATMKAMMQLTEPPVRTLEPKTNG